MLLQFIYNQIVTKALYYPFVKTEKSDTFLYLIPQPKNIFSAVEVVTEARCSGVT